MEFDILENGDLKITASEELRAELGQDSELWQETFDHAVMEDGWRSVAPVDIGALTEAPFICDDNWTVEDDGTFRIYPETKLWWFPNYQIEDPLETLRNTGEVIFQTVERVRGVNLGIWTECGPGHTVQNKITDIDTGEVGEPIEIPTNDGEMGKPGPGCEHCDHKGYVQKMHCKVSCFECGDSKVVEYTGGQIKLSMREVKGPKS